MMIRGLLGKELRQNSFTFAVLFILLLAGLGVITGNHRLSRMTGSDLFGLQMLVGSLFPLACLTLGQVLIASEFRQRTQLFLEGLPLPRWRFLTVKYLLGLLTVLMMAAIALGVVLWRIWEKEAMNPDFAMMLGAKVGGWIFFIYSLFFAHAFLGRYRWAAAGAIVVLLLNLSALGLNVRDFPPLKLFDLRFAYERYSFPVEDLLWTVLIGAVVASVGFMLGLVRDATVASLLAERMSGREKSFVAVLIFAAVLGSAVVIEKREEASPMHLPGAVVSAEQRVTVSVAASADRPTPPEIKTMREVSARLAGELQQVAEYLGISNLPPVFVVHRRDFTADRMENGGLPNSQGLLVRVNLQAEGFDQQKLQRWLITNLLLVRSEGRLALERNSWLLDGFPHWWSSRAAAETENTASPAIVDAAAKAALIEDWPAVWFSVRKATGTEAAESLAVTGLHVLQQTAGEQKTQKFLAAVLGRSATKDARTWFRETVNPWSSLLQRETGVTAEQLNAAWRAAATTTKQ